MPEEERTRLFWHSCCCSRVYWCSYWGVMLMLENRNAAVAMLLDQQSRFTSSPVSTGVVAIFRWPSTLCLTSHPGQLSFLFVGWKMSTGYRTKWGVKARWSFCVRIHVWVAGDPINICHTEHSSGEWDSAYSTVQMLRLLTSFLCLQFSSS